VFSVAHPSVLSVFSVAHPSVLSVFSVAHPSVVRVVRGPSIPCHPWLTLGIVRVLRGRYNSVLSVV
jgi:hypothetical protein